MADASDGRVTLWRYGEVYFDLREPPPDVEHHEYIARPRADDAREERLKAAEARAARCPLCRSELDVDEMEPDETDGLTEMRPDGAGVCSECYGRWHDAKVYKARAERAEAECAAREDVQARLIKERNAAEAERDSARALLREARGYVKTVYHQQACMGGGQTESDLLARIDAELEGA